MSIGNENPVRWREANGNVMYLSAQFIFGFLTNFEKSYNSKKCSYKDVINEPFLFSVY